MNKTVSPLAFDTGKRNCRSLGFARDDKGEVGASIWCNGGDDKLENVVHSGRNLSQASQTAPNDTERMAWWRDLREVCGEAYHLGSYLDKEELAMEETVNNLISQEELASLATKLRNDLVDYEDKLGSYRDFAEVKKSAGALVVAILQPVKYRLSAYPPKKAVRVYDFPPQKGSIPSSLH